MKRRLDAHGNLSFWFVLPTTSLRQLVERKLRAMYPELNYRIDWKDVHGWGLHLSHVPETYGPPRPAIRRDTSFMYRHPGYDLLHDPIREPRYA